MLAIVLMDHLLRHRAQNMGVQSTTPVVPAEAESTNSASVPHTLG
jgi:chorismate synthase